MLMLTFLPGMHRNALALEQVIVPARKGPASTPVSAFYNQLFVRAADRAPTIQTARARLEQRAGQRYTAWAKRLAPALSGRLSLVQEINNETGTDPEDNSNTYQDGDSYADWDLNLNLPLYRRSSVLQVDAAELAARAAANALALTTRELDIDLKERLARYLDARYRFFNIQNSVILSQEHVQRIRRGYELRDQTRLQLLRAEANLKELEARHDLEQQRLTKTFNDLLEFSGLDAEDPLFTQLDQLLSDEKNTARAIKELADLAQGYHHIAGFIQHKDTTRLRDYFQKHSLLYQKIILEHALGMVKARTYTQEEWPELAIKGSYSRREDSRFEDYDGTGSLSLVLSTPLFTGGTLFSTQKTRSGAEQEARVQRNTELRKQYHSLENLQARILSLRKVYDLQQLHLQQQKEIVDLSLKSYAIKQTSMQDLLTSKNRLIDAKNDLMQTTTELGILYRRLAFELGCPLPTGDSGQH